MLNVNTELINRAQKGDVAVIGALYEHFHLSVYRYLYYRVGNEQVAEDLTSEVFIRMLRFLSGFHPPSASFPSWLFQIARNLVADHFRSRDMKNNVELEESVISATDDIDTTVERKLNTDSLRKALDKLSEDQREVIVLRFIAGMPIAEVAQALDRSEDAIKGLQRRALIGLREILADWEISYA
jgi:RNA polymerase sigma-70 factor (ECF subfamily)